MNSHSKNDFMTNENSLRAEPSGDGPLMNQNGRTQSIPGF